MEKRHNHDENKVTSSLGTPALTFANSSDRQPCRMIRNACKHSQVPHTLSSAHTMILYPQSGQLRILKQKYANGIKLSWRVTIEMYKSEVSVGFDLDGEL